MLVHAVIVAGDGAGANVDSRADFRVAQISEMVGLRSLAQLDLLGLDEVADVRALADLAARPQMRVRSDESLPALTCAPSMTHPGRTVTPSSISESRITLYERIRQFPPIRVLPKSCT